MTTDVLAVSKDVWLVFEPTTFWLRGDDKTILSAINLNSCQILNSQWLYLELGEIIVF